MSWSDQFFARSIGRHEEEMVAGLHDTECEWRLSCRLCHCSKRRREAVGFTVPPMDDLVFPPPDCPRCDRELWLDGDSWRCDPCCLSWDSDGAGGSARFTDDHGDLSELREGGAR